MVERPLAAAFLTEGYREGRPDVPPCPEGWVAVMYHRHSQIALVLGAYGLWSAAKSSARVLKGPSLSKAWIEARSLRPDRETWEDVRLIRKLSFDAVLVAQELSQ